VITAAEAIVQLYGDMAGVSRTALTRPGPNDEIMWFLLQRLLEERTAEFVHGLSRGSGPGPSSGFPEAVAHREAEGATSVAARLRAHPACTHPSTVAEEAAIKCA
jgi:hypothetical protein